MSEPSTTRNHEPPPRRRLLSLPALLSIGIVIAFMYFVATRFNLDWSKTWDNVRGMNPWLYVLAFVLYYSSFLLRGLRWQVLARNAQLHRTPNATMPSVLRFSQLILIGWFVNSIAWLRIGDPYRAYALSEESNGDFSSILGTVLAERLTDMVTVLVLILFGVAWFSATRDSGGTWHITGAAFLMALALGALLALMKGYGSTLTRFLPRPLRDRYRRFHRGALGSLKQLPLIFLLGVAAWVLETARLFFVLQALDLSIVLPLVLVVALGNAILSTVPTPGGVGVVEPGVTGLLVLALERSDAVSVALVDRTITYVSVVAIGGLTFLLWRASRARSLRARRVDRVELGSVQDPPGR